MRGMDALSADKLSLAVREVRGDEMKKLVHDHLEDLDAGPERVREAAYRRGCHQAIDMAMRVLTRNSIPADRWPWMLERLADRLSQMQSSKKDYPSFMDEAFRSAWGIE